jgi:hypothetical protein
MYTMTGEMESGLVPPVPHRPAISNVLLKASANVAFRGRLLSNPADALAGMNLPPEDVAVLSGVATSDLKEFARQVQSRLMLGRFVAETPSIN